MKRLLQDQSNGWTADLTFPEYPSLSQDRTCDWLILGGGYTGLSAALTLRSMVPEQSVVLLDAHQPAQGASARNSGYLVDSTLNDGHLSDAGLQAYRSKYQLARRALEYVASLVDTHSIECEWNPCGKFHAAHGSEQLEKLERFSDVLSSLNLTHRLMDADALAQRLGTEYYRHAVWTDGAVMLQPGKLALGLLRALQGVDIYGDTQATRIRSAAGGVQVDTPQAVVTASRVLVCTNAGLRPLGQSRTFPLYLTASLTRPFEQLPDEYGLLSAQAMGATLRVTSDKRVMIRNTAQVDSLDPQRHLEWHLRGLKRRFDWIEAADIEHTWGGYTCISGNSANVFEQTDERIWSAGCYNGGGIGLGCLFGQQIALAALGQDTPEQAMIAQRPKPNWLPPEPFLGAGVRLRLARDRRLARNEV